MKKSVRIDVGESKDGDDNNAVSKENVTERLAGTRQVKFNQLWTEFMNKLADLNQVRIINEGSRILYPFLTLESDQRIGNTNSRM